MKKENKVVSQKNTRLEKFQEKISRVDKYPVVGGIAQALDVTWIKKNDKKIGLSEYQTFYKSI